MNTPTTITVEAVAPRTLEEHHEETLECAIGCEELAEAALRMVPHSRTMAAQSAETCRLVASVARYHADAARILADADGTTDAAYLAEEAEEAAAEAEAYAASLANL